MRISLVNTGNDPEIGGNANAQAYPPLGIVSLATALNSAFPGQLELQLLDGQVDDQGLLRRELGEFSPDLVGISMYNTSIRGTLALARHAAEFGARVVLGNDHAAVHAETLLARVPEVEWICLEDEGEPVLTALVAALLRGDEPVGIPGLLGRSPSGARGSTTSRGPARLLLEHLPIPDRSLLPMRYWRSYTEAFLRQRRRAFDTSGVTGVTTINRARGCARSKQPCSYCGIADLRPRGSSGDRFWKDAARAREQVGANVLYESFDSASSWPSLLREWLAARPEELTDTALFLYAQANESSQETVDLFRELGVFCVNCGMDSGHTDSLRLLKGRHDALETNRSAALRWTDAGIEMHTSFVLFGLGDERRTRESLDATVEFAEWLADNTHVVSLDSAMFYPDRDARVGRWIWEPQLARTEAPRLGWDFIDLEVLDEVSAKWRDRVDLNCFDLCIDFARICRTDPQILVEANRAIREISDRAGLNFGHSLAGAEPIS